MVADTDRDSARALGGAAHFQPGFGAGAFYLYFVLISDFLRGIL